MPTGPTRLRTAGVRVARGRTSRRRSRVGNSAGSATARASSGLQPAGRNRAGNPNRSSVCRSGRPFRQRLRGRAVAARADPARGSPRHGDRNETRHRTSGRRSPATGRPASRPVWPRLPCPRTRGSLVCRSVGTARATRSWTTASGCAAYRRRRRPTYGARALPRTRLRRDQRVDGGVVEALADMAVGRDRYPLVHLGDGAETRQDLAALPGSRPSAEDEHVPGHAAETPARQGAGRNSAGVSSIVSETPARQGAGSLRSVGSSGERAGSYASQAPSPKRGVRFPQSPLRRCRAELPGRPAGRRRGQSVSRCRRNEGARPHPPEEPAESACGPVPDRSRVR